jgi:Subtilase family/Fervidolysin N-terminal prodomain/Abnormal spindle-like microcephaly-assoc'd, ASPM-SPD-2-Hydin/HYDIN/CFA65/VesB-like, Ig-like domain/FlgD Ig-like domain/Viral BACON domain
MLRNVACVCFLLGVFVLGFSLNAAQAPAVPPANYVPGEVILKFKSNATQHDKDQIYAELGGAKVKGLGRINAELRRVETMTVDEAVSRYRSHAKIEYIEPNYIVQANETPNDPLFPQLYGLNNTGQTGGTVDADIDAPQAWDVFTGSSSVLIGVIDTGVDYTHPDLAANIWTNPGEIPGNNIDDDNNGFIDDVHGYDFINNDGDPMDDHSHGSHVSGTIGGVGNNGIGVAGVNWNVKIMGLKFLSASGSGSTADAVEAIDYATMMHVRLTSNSWGGGGFSQALLDAINDADAAGVLFVCAAGNNSSNTDVTPNYPSTYPSPNIVAVAATDHNDNLASFSNYGATTVDLAAPGVNIVSTTPGNTYSTFSGTSMATPHVAGALGLVFGRFPNIGHMDAKNLIMSFVDHKASLAGKCVTGGRLNAFFPIAEPDSIPPGAITNLAVTGTTSNGATIQWTAPGDDGSTGTASSYVVKVSSAAITEANFAAATPVPNPPDPGPTGTLESMEAGGLAFNTTYFFAVKARDEFGNEGGVSNSPSGTTLGIPDVDVAPVSLSATLLTGGTADQNLGVSNVGQGTLDFNIPTPDLVTNAVEQQPFATYGKDEIDPRTGNPVTQGTGGPDAFGYRWVDSDEPFGPSFVWNDISATGTAVSFGSTDDANAGPFPIGFNFAFYGVTYTDFRVCTNGWLSFTSTSTAYSNQGLPNAGSPLNLVAPFWDDLNVLSGGTVYYQSTGTDLIVQWTNVAHYSAGGPYTFQAVLHADGSIEYYYLSMVDPLNSATVGIQNATGSDGLNIAFNVPYLHNNMAIRLQAVPQWLTVSPTSGRVYAPGSTNLNVHFGTEGLLGGSYQGNVRILSNDPDEPMVTVPVTLTVIGAPDVNLAPSSYDFGQVFLNASPTTQVQVQNPGTDVLHVSGVTIVGGGYTVAPTSFDVPPHGSQNLTVTFHPTAVAMYPATLTVASDDPDEPTASMTLAGEGVVPPAFSVTPTELSSALFTGQIQSQQLTLHNSGGAPLTYSIATDLGTERVIYPDHELAKGEEDPGPGVLGQGGPDAFGYSWKDSDDPSGPTFNWMDISGTGTPIAALTGDDQNAGPINLGFSFPFYGTNFTTVRVCTNGWLSFTSTSTSFSNAALPTGGTTLPNNLIAPFWDDLHFRSVQKARYLADGTKFIVQYTAVDKVSPSGASLTFQVILYPNGTIVYQYLTMTGTLNSATIGIQNATRTVGLTVAHNINYVHNNLAIRIQTAPEWLTAAPLSGSIPPGGQQVVNATFNATDLFGGLYEGGLNITTNDPLAPLVNIPAALTVTGAPNIQLSTSSIDFGIVYVGYPKLREYQVFNSGTDDLVITGFPCNNAEFSEDVSDISLPLTLAPLTGTVLRARFAPGDVGLETGILGVESNDPDTPTANVAVSGQGLLPPVIGATPASLSADLYTNQTTDQTVTLHNTGQSDLSFQIESHTSLGVEAIPPDPEGIDIGKNEADPRQGILGAGGPDAFGYRWADSDAPNGPPYNWIDISATGTPVFASRSDDVNTGPFAVGFNFPFYGSAFNQFRVGSNGFLSFTSTATDLSNDPLPSTNAPENLIAVLWDDLLVDPAQGGQVFYQSEPARLIVQWNNVMKYSEQSGPKFTFEAILFRNGVILTQYKAVGTTTNSLTIGIQNAARTVGLTVAYNQAYVDQNLAVRFSTLPDWLSANPSDGTIPAGGSMDIQAHFDATGLFGGVYNGDLRILSNDPANGALLIPATLSVTGIPDLELSAAGLDFGDVYVGYPESLPLIASNLGSDLLHVTSVTPGLPDYTVSPSSFDLAPYESRTMTVTLSPSGAGMRNTNLTIQSNDPASPHTVALSGNGVLPPVISTEPATVAGTAAPGGQTTRPLHLCNTGGSDLTFTLNWVEASGGATTVYNELKLPKGSDTPGSPDVADPRPGILGSGGPDAFGYRWVDSDDPNGPDFNWTDISGVGTPVNFGTYTDDGTVGPFPIGFNFSFYGNSFSQFHICTNGWVSFTEGTLHTYANQPLPNNGADTPANLLAPFWDDMVYDSSDNSAVYYYNDGTRTIIQYYVRRIAQHGSPPFYKFQVILYPNGSIVYQYDTLGTTVNSATVGIQNGTKTDGLTVVYNAAYLHNGLAVKFSARPDWLSVSPEAGTVAAGQCVDLTVAMNAASLAAGDYFAEIQIQSNDPAHPMDTTPVVFHVCQVQVAAIEVDPNTLNASAQGNYIAAYVELPAGYDPAQITLGSVRLNGTVAASTQISEIGDWNSNGVPDLMLKFPRAAVEAALQEGDQVPVTVTGEIDDVCTFTGTDMVRVIRPHLTHPNGGESYVAGVRALVEWQNPNGWTVDHAQIQYSPDNGDNWSVVDDHLTGQSYVWAVPLEPTQNGRLRVVLVDGNGVMGYDSSDGPFIVQTSTTGIAETLPTVHRLYQNSPNPFQGATRTAFDLPEPGKVTLKVFDLSGREVRVLADEWYPAGNHEVSWNARDAAGNPIAGGIYFLHIQAGSFSDTKRMYLQK